MNEINVYNGCDVNTLWTDRIAILQFPEASRPTSLAATATAAATSSLNAGKYYYAVTAIGMNGESIASLEVNATTDSTDNTVVLTFDEQTGVDEYRVYRGTTSGSYTCYFIARPDGAVPATITVTDDGTLMLEESYDYYSATKIFAKGDLAVRANVLYESANSSNLNNAPTASSGYWRVIKAMTPAASANLFYSTIRKSDIMSVVPYFSPELLIDGETKAKRSYIRLEKQNGTQYNIDLLRVANQPTWNLGTAAATQTALADIESWLV